MRGVALTWVLSMTVAWRGAGDSGLSSGSAIFVAGAARAVSVVFADQREFSGSGVSRPYQFEAC
jgi:hypothetical protein